MNIWDKGLITLAGAMIGVAGAFIYEHFVGDRRSRLLHEEIDKINVSLAEINKELRTLKLAIERKQQLRNRNRRVVGAPSLATDTDTEMFSALGNDDVDDEFFDFSSENDVVVEEAKKAPYEEIDALLDGNSQQDKTKAYGLLLELLDTEGENEEVLWRLTKACHLMSSVYAAKKDIDKKKEFIDKGVEFGKKAMAVNNSNWKAHKWFAICIGARGQLLSHKEKLRDGQVFKEHVDIAIGINSNDPTLHHLLGRFHYEVSTLSWFEKKVANTLFGEIPPASISGAIQSLLEAEKLHATPWKENQLLLAKCYIANQEYTLAMHWLDSAKEIPPLNAEDELADVMIDLLIKKYKTYREQVS